MSETANTKLIAYAPFEVDGKAYQAGDEFTPPSHFFHDLEQEELTHALKKDKRGMVYTWRGEWINKGEKNSQLWEYHWHTSILPVAEGVA